MRNKRAQRCARVPGTLASDCRRVHVVLTERQISDNTTRVAVIGCGDIARTAHLPAWGEEARAQVTCVVDVDAQAGTDLVLMVAENWPYASSYIVAREALADGRVGEPFLLQSSHHSDLRLVRARGRARATATTPATSSRRGSTR